MTARGFTLVELLVVMAIMAGVAALAGATWRLAADRAGARLVLGELRAARWQAIAARGEVAWVPHDLPGGVTVAAKPAPVRFFADGGSSGAEITIVAGPRRRVIDVDWLTGHAALREAAS
jgi:general secretion pathway protein H